MNPLILCSLLMLIGLQPLAASSLVFPPYGHSYGIRKATQAHLFMFFGPATTFDNPQGMAAAKLVSRDDPQSEHDDDEVIVYGVNAGRHELIYNTSMWSLARYGKQGQGEGCFFHPRGVAIDERGNVFVADSGNNRVVQLFNPLKKVNWVRSFNGPSKTTPFNGPAQVALDNSCRIYVSDSKNNRIVVMDTLRTLLRIIQPSDTIRFSAGPTMLAVADGAYRYSYYRNERIVFCADMQGRRLWKIDAATGAVLKVITMPQSHRAHYGAIDYYHNIWVTDTEKHCIVKFDHNLTYLDTFGSQGSGDNEFLQPRGIAIWKRYGQTFIAEQSGAQYYWLGTNCRQPKLIRDGDNNAKLHMHLTDHSFVSLFKTQGKDTITLIGKRLIAAGQSLTSLTQQRLEPTARYLLRVEPTYSSYTFYHWDYPLTVQ
jgi:hypothetical protein